jgi:hypothetical protein
MSESSVSPKQSRFSELVHELLAALDTRSKDILKRRYGLETGNEETLESIGQEYGITRERVRQIESQAKKVLVTRLPVLEPAVAVLERIFQEHGGLLPEHRIVELTHQQVGETVLPTIVSFYLEIAPPYTYVTSDDHFAPHWRHPELYSDQAKEVVKVGRALLHELQHPKQETEFIDSIREQVGKDLPDTHVAAWLLTSRHMRRNPFGEWGLVGWAETTPRGVGDKAYAVLRRHGRPEHFRKVAELINKAGFDRKSANAQTVHNELIKDKRFVLVGRGLYGLTEWGYVPGTVADVLESFLKKSAHPLTREELIEQVLSQRLVKKNTILLSLQDENRFVKTAENRYTLKEKS